jgi:hypothetical protein
VAVEGGARFRPRQKGVYFLIGEADTLGSLSVNPDPRESVLTRATDRTVENLWRGTRLVSLQEGPRVAFTAASRRDLRPPFLWLALVLGLAEAGLAAWRRQR